jgi:TRAP-type C4-dicarboxylate transport system permease large subunit
MHFIAIIALVIFILRTMSSRHTNQAEFRRLLFKTLRYSAVFALVCLVALVGFAWYVNKTDVVNFSQPNPYLQHSR